MRGISFKITKVFWWDQNIPINMGEKLIRVMWKCKSFAWRGEGRGGIQFCQLTFAVSLLMEEEMISKLLKSSVWVLSCSVFENVMHCVIWYHLYSLNMNNTNGGNLKVTLLHGFFTFFKLHKWYQIAQRITLVLLELLEKSYQQSLNYQVQLSIYWLSGNYLVPLVKIQRVHVFK